MSRHGFDVTIHLLSGKTISALVESMSDENGIFVYFGEPPEEDEDDGEEYENNNAFLRIPVVSVDYIEEGAVRQLSRNEDYGILKVSGKSVAKLMVSGKTKRLEEVD